MTRCATEVLPQAGAAEPAHRRAAGRDDRRRRQPERGDPVHHQRPDLEQARDVSPAAVVDGGQEGAGRRRRRHVAERRQAGAVGADRSHEGGGPRRAGLATPRRRCGCWSAATRSRPTTKAASSTKCTSARVQGNRQTAAAIEQLTVPSATARQRPAARTSRGLTPGTAPSEINRLNRQRQVTVFAGLLPGVVADAGDGR